jgi:hypothetical protein
VVELTLLTKYRPSSKSEDFVVTTVVNSEPTKV